ncbi:hypothetical protein CGRA01v4_09942 [Colletotrichum graminicola]|nr:hypothetical protein CGRA01v4_09942 [Colletotrichum graminicola]
MVFVGIDFWHYPATRGSMRATLTLTGLVRLSYGLTTLSVLPFPALFPSARHAEIGGVDLRSSLVGCPHRRHSRR